MLMIHRWVEEWVKIMYFGHLEIQTPQSMIATLFSDLVFLNLGVCSRKESSYLLIFS
jgi:hypothetical protein